MNYKEKMRKAIECPQFGDLNYGEWGILTLEQRQLIRRLLDESDRADSHIKEIYRQNLIMEHYLELIYDIGYDYDGLNDKESLKGLIDELIHYASLGRACNTTEPIYCNEDKKFNILHEEIK